MGSLNLLDLRRLQRLLAIVLHRRLQLAARLAEAGPRQLFEEEEPAKEEDDFVKAKSTLSFVLRVHMEVVVDVEKNEVVEAGQETLTRQPG